MDSDVCGCAEQGCRYSRLPTCTDSGLPVRLDFGSAQFEYFPGDAGSAARGLAYLEDCIIQPMVFVRIGIRCACEAQARRT